MFPKLIALGAVVASFATDSLALDNRGKEGESSSVWLASGHRFWLRANNKRGHNGQYVLSNEVEGQDTVYYDGNGKGRTACMWKIEYVDADADLKSGTKIFIISYGAGERYMHSNQAHMNHARGYGWSWGGKSGGQQWQLVWDGDLNAETKVSIVALANDAPAGFTKDNWCSTYGNSKGFHYSDDCGDDVWALVDMDWIRSTTLTTTTIPTTVTTTTVTTATTATTTTTPNLETNNELSERLGVCCKDGRCSCVP